MTKISLIGFKSLQSLFFFMVILTFSFFPNHGVSPLSIHFEGTLTGNNNAPMPNVTIVLQGLFNSQWVPMGINPKTDSAGKYFADTTFTVENGWVPGTIEQLRAFFQGDTTNPAVISASKTVTIDPAPTYDSDWINLAGKQGQYVTISHNLNSINLIIEINGRTTASGNIHQKYLGLIGYKPGWQKTYGYSGDFSGQWGSGIVENDDLEYAIAGQIKSVPMMSGRQAYLIGVDSNGVLKWDKTYDPNLNGGRANCVVKDGSGGFVFAGSIFVESVAGMGFNAYLVRTDVNGNALWKKNYGGTGYDCANWLVKTSDGGYAMVGYTNSSGAGGNDVYLIKTDASGNLLWSKTYGGGGDDVGHCLVQTPDGGYAIVGQMAGLIYFLKTDATGNSQIVKTLSNGVGYSLVLTSDGGYVIAGQKAGLGVYVVKLDATGSLLWDGSYGGDVGRCIIKTKDGGFAIVGRKAGFGVYLVEIDTSGKILSSNTYGGDEGCGIIQTSDGAFGIIGSKSVYSSYCYFIKTPIHGEFGLARTDSTANTVTLYRGANDNYWNFARVRIWKIP